MIAPEELKLISQDALEYTLDCFQDLYATQCAHYAALKNISNNPLSILLHELPELQDLDSSITSSEKNMIVSAAQIVLMKDELRRRVDHVEQDLEMV